MTTRFLPVKCRCAYRGCPDWHVSPVADVHSVCMTKRQAVVTALALQILEPTPERVARRAADVALLTSTLLDGSYDVPDSVLDQIIEEMSR